MRDGHMITFTLGNVNSTLTFPAEQRDNIGSALQRHLTAEIPSARFSWAFKSGDWDGRVRLFDDDQGQFTFLTGLVPTVLTALEEANLPVNLAFNDQRQKLANITVTVLNSCHLSGDQERNVPEFLFCSGLESNIKSDLRRNLRKYKGGPANHSLEATALSRAEIADQFAFAG